MAARCWERVAIAAIALIGAAVAGPDTASARSGDGAMDSLVFSRTVLQPGQAARLCAINYYVSIQAHVNVQLAIVEPSNLGSALSVQQVQIPAGSDACITFPPSG